MEQYLAGVLGAEMPLDWGESALVAQAIAARTYALYELTNQKRSPFFDVYDTTRSQVYVGRTIETEKALRAVSRSRGLVLTWQDQPFKCFFHSTCGGQTVDSSLVFPKHDITPLSGRPCKNCQSSSVYRWKNVFSRKQVVGKLAEGLERPIDALERIEVLERSGGRVVKIQVVVDGQAFTLSGPQFRGFIGYDRKALPSTAFEVQLEGERVIFAGRGWGHGVGMCQFGAKGMADRGDAGSDIVRFYYPGADLIKFW